MGTQVGIGQCRRESGKVGDLPGLCPARCSVYAFLRFSIDHSWAEDQHEAVLPSSGSSACCADASFKILESRGHGL
ncbi:uncharacterized [Tachysurus ichikawai]